jgi:hypothetical protein
MRRVPPMYAVVPLVLLVLLLAICAGCSKTHKPLPAGKAPVPSQNVQGKAIPPEYQTREPGSPPEVGGPPSGAKGGKTKAPEPSPMGGPPSGEAPPTTAPSGGGSGAPPAGAPPGG